MPGAGDAVEHAAHRGREQSAGVGVVRHGGLGAWWGCRHCVRCETLASVGGWAQRRLGRI